MNVSDETAEAVSNWMSYAQLDLKAAETLLQKSHNFASQVCFHSQQSAEKAIKAALIFLDIDFPFIHDLNKLRKLLPKEWTCYKEENLDMDMLSNWAVQSRYPESANRPTVGQAITAFETAERIMASIKADLKLRGWP
ncbi:MAG: HEPN domain-containing protein [Cyanobacteria bacterium J06626_6]